MDEQALSYAEIKALCAGNPLIAEKMGLDVEVAKLKMLKASHQSQLYRLEDNLRLNFPKQIETAKAAIEGYRADVSRLEANTVNVSEGISPMTIGGGSYSERKEAGAAIIEACSKIKNVGQDKTKIGTYRGFEVLVSYDFHGSKYDCHLKGAMTHTIPLGTDPVGNITRIDNALEKISATLAATEEKLETLYSQVENAKVELTKPFPQEAELAAKSARLTELDSLLSLDGKDEPATVGGGEIDGDGTPEKILAVKEGNAELSGDETTSQVPEAPQPQFPRPAPQTTTPVIKDGSAAVAVKSDIITGDDNDSTQSPPNKAKKKGHDER